MSGKSVREAIYEKKGNIANPRIGSYTNGGGLLPF